MCSERHMFYQREHLCLFSLSFLIVVNSFVLISFIFVSCFIDWLSVALRRLPPPVSAIFFMYLYPWERKLQQSILGPQFSQFVLLFPSIPNRSYHRLYLAIGRTNVAIDISTKEDSTPIILILTYIEHCY